MVGESVEPNFRIRGGTPTWIVAVCVAIAIALVLGLGIGVFLLGGHDSQTPLKSSDAMLDECIDKLHTAISRPADVDPYTHEEKIERACGNKTHAQLSWRDFEMRRQAYIRAGEDGKRINLVAMTILLFATASGVILSGL